MELVCAAHYRRRLPTTAKRVWENVRDWQHLPWLHRSSFSSIELLGEGEWGWRARIGLQPAGDEILVELCIDPSAPRYVARTLEGELRGAEVWTEVHATSADATDVEVAFWVPDAGPAAVEEIGRGYLALYRQLWDEDEAMMVRRAAELRAPRPVPRNEAARLRLGGLDELRQRLPLLVSWAGRRFRIVELEDGLVVHATRCPHLLGPLESVGVEDGCVVCPWHGYRFDLRSGRSTDGRGLCLDRAPRVAMDPDGSLWLQSQARIGGRLSHM